MSRLTRRFFCLAVLAVSISLLAACQKTTPSTPDLPDLKVGVVGVEQPKGTTDLLAGFIPEAVSYTHLAGTPHGCKNMERPFPAGPQIDNNVPPEYIYPFHFYLSHLRPPVCATSRSVFVLRRARCPKF